jgi:Ankyrin repeats (3 copies)
MHIRQVCLGILLNSVEENGLSPLVEYSAKHWVTHVRSGGVSPCPRKAIEYLFDPDKPHFVAWLNVHNTDTQPNPNTPLHMFTYNNKPSTLAPPLYYAALHGFQDLTKRLVDKNPKSLNKRGGFWGTPLVAALAQRHRRIAKLLRDGGADVNVHGYD